MREQRRRLLPARVVLYFVLAMCLFSGRAYEEVARLLTCGLQDERRWEGTWRVPSTGAIGRTRLRLGSEPLKALFARVCRPVATEATVGAWYRRWRLVAVDGSGHSVRPNDRPQRVSGQGSAGNRRLVDRWHPLGQ